MRFDENVPCARCGQFGAYLFDGDPLCGECYEKSGSCCPEFGADDLWQNAEKAAPHGDGGELRSFPIAGRETSELKNPECRTSGGSGSFGSKDSGLGS